MNILGQMLDDREDRHRDQGDADDRWMREGAGVDPAARLIAWDRWICTTLAKTLQWPGNEAARTRLIRQCAAELTTLAKQLRGRGWLMDGDALAAHVRALLKPIAAAQKAGTVGDFWPYFRASVSRYVGLNAEEIQAHARRSGADQGTVAFGDVLAGLGIGSGAKPRGASMTELLVTRAAEINEANAETLRQKQTRLRAQERARHDHEQQSLF